MIDGAGFGPEMWAAFVIACLLAGAMFFMLRPPPS